MSQLLAALLGVNPTLLGQDLERLENASGRDAIDIRLATELTTKVRQKSRELGLDPKDTTGEELYHALNSLAGLHDDFLFKRIGGQASDTTEDLLAKIAEATQNVKSPKKVWVLKYSVAKKLLKNMPPKKVMKYLGYKSLDSILKREPVGELFAGIMLLESPQWRENFIKQYHSLTQMDFEVRDINVLCLKSKRWEKASADFVRQQKHIIASLRELGIVLVLPAPLDRRPGMTITMLPQVLHHMNEVRLYTSFYKLHQMQSDFGAILAASLLYDLGNHVYLAGNKVHWRVVQRHFGAHGKDRHPEILEPHVQPDDFSWRKVEAILFRLEPALHFWDDTDYVAMSDGRPVSLNLMDVALNYFNNLPYNSRTYGHFQSSLWNELYMRYMGMPALEHQVLEQLDYEATPAEVLAVIRSIK